jgi:threonine/homoserine/homoserine lactone efflux protein
MSNLLFLFGSAFVVGFSGAMMPGPVLTATISEVMKRGFKAGPLIVLGHAILEMCVLVGVVAGLGAWITRDAVMGFLGIGGGILLILMGAQMALTAKAAVREALASSGDAKAAVRGPMLTGILTSVSNPYWTIWWATIGLNYAALALQSGLVGLSSFYAGHILSDLTWYSLVAAAVASGRKICPAWLYQLLIVLCGLALVGLGGYFLAGGAARFG